VPVSWRFANGVVFLESIEDATFEAWREAVDEFLAHPDYRPGMGVVHDWRRLSGVLLASEIVVRSAYLTRHLSEAVATRWALVASADAAFGMGRMAEAFVNLSAIQVRVFRDLAEAEAWVRGE
jgi:hypothetical protein